MWQRKQWDTARMEMHCAPYYICAFRPKTGAHPNHGEEGQGRTLCLGCTLLLWVFIHICQKFVIICIMLFLPLVQVISEHYINVPSQLPKADELQDTAADIFKHHCPFSTQRALGYLRSTCMHSHVYRGKDLRAHLLGKQSLQVEGKEWAAVAETKAKKHFTKSVLNRAPAI